MSTVLHPEGLLDQIVRGLGFPAETLLAAPAVATDLTYTVEGRYWERLLALTVSLVTDANAANRTVSLQVLDQDGLIVVAVPAAAVQAASLTRVYSFLPTVAVASGPVGGGYLSPAPHFFLMPTWQLRVHVDTVQAGDQVSAARLYRERFLTGPQGYPIGEVPARPAA